MVLTDYIHTRARVCSMSKSYAKAVKATRATTVSMAVLQHLGWAATDDDLDEITGYLISNGKTRKETPLGAVIEAHHLVNEDGSRQLSAQKFCDAVAVAVAEGARQYVDDKRRAKVNKRGAPARPIDVSTLRAAINLSELCEALIKALSWDEEDASTKQRLEAVRRVCGEAQAGVGAGGGKVAGNNGAKGPSTCGDKFGTKFHVGKMNVVAEGKTLYGGNQGGEMYKGDSGGWMKSSGVGDKGLGKFISDHKGGAGGKREKCGPPRYGKNGVEIGKAAGSTTDPRVDLSRKLMVACCTLLWSCNPRKDPWDIPDVCEWFRSYVVGDPAAKKSSPKLLLGICDRLAQQYADASTSRGPQISDATLLEIAQGCFNKISDAFTSPELEMGEHCRKELGEAHWGEFFRSFNNLAHEQLGGKKSVRDRQNVETRLEQIVREKRHSAVASTATGLETVVRQYRIFGLGESSDSEALKQQQRDAKETAKGFHTEFRAVLTENSSANSAATADRPEFQFAEAVLAKMTPTRTGVERRVLMYFLCALSAAIDEPNIRAAVSRLDLKSGSAREILQAFAGDFAEKIRDDSKSQRLGSLERKTAGNATFLKGLGAEAVDAVLNHYEATSLVRAHLPSKLRPSFENASKEFRVGLDQLKSAGELLTKLQNGSSGWVFKDYSEAEKDVALSLLTDQGRAECESNLFWELFGEAFPGIKDPEQRANLRNAKRKQRQDIGPDPLTMFMYCEALVRVFDQYDANGNPTPTPQRTAVKLLCFGGWFYARKTDVTADGVKTGTVGDDEKVNESAVSVLKSVATIVDELCDDAPQAAADPTRDQALWSFLSRFVKVQRADLFEEVAGQEDAREVIAEERPSQKRRLTEAETPAPSPLSGKKYVDIDASWVSRVKEQFLDAGRQRLRRRDFKPHHFDLMEDVLKKAKELNGAPHGPERKGVHDGKQPTLMLGPWAHISHTRPSGLLVVQATEEMPNFFTCHLFPVAPGLFRPRECSATNVVINYGVVTRVHVDSLNTSPTDIVSLGKFDFGLKSDVPEQQRCPQEQAGLGERQLLGDLWKYEENPIDKAAAFSMKCPSDSRPINLVLGLARGRPLPGVAVNIHRTWHNFDARVPHATLPTRTRSAPGAGAGGGRMCLIFFEHRRSVEILKRMEMASAEDDEDEQEPNQKRVEQARKTKKFLRYHGWL
eukprot:g8233.t1